MYYLSNKKFMEANIQDMNKLSIRAWTLEFALTSEPEKFYRLGWVNDLEFKALDSDSKQIKSADLWNLLNLSYIWAEISGTFLKNVDAEIMSKLLWIKKIDIAGTSTDIVDEIWVLKQGEILFLKNKNWNWTAVSSLEVKNKGKTKTFAVNTDYEIVNSNWKTGIVAIKNWTITNWSEINISYSYTPNEAEEVELNHRFRVKPDLVVRIRTLPEESGKFNTIKMENCLYEWEYTLAFDDMEESDTKGTSFKFTANKNSKTTVRIEHL